MNNKPIISLSTSYLQKRFEGDGYAMLQYAAELGFDYVELGHSTTISSIEGIIKAVEEGVIKVSSLHNFCPIPLFAKGASPNLFSPATKSKIESDQWLRHTKNTLDFARMFNARAVVMHLGFLSYFFFNPTAKLEKFILEHQDENLLENKEYLGVVKKFMASAQKRAEKIDYKNIEKNIRAISDIATEKDLLLGLENREGADELPLDWNFEKLVNALKIDTPARTWHDVGHSMRKQLLGFGDQIELIERTKDSIIGWHLHDCSNEGKDHIAIGKGCIDFKKISQYFDPSKHIFTLELNRAVRSRDAIDSLKRVQDLF